MDLSRRLKKFLETFISIFILATSIISLTIINVSAETLPAVLTTQPQVAAMNRTKAVVKNLEGKAQEMLGDITNDPKNQTMGAAKQFEGQMRNVAEDIKDQMQPTGRATSVMKGIEGKIQETAGNLTGDIQDQAAGKAKQIEGSSRGLIEDVKDNIENIFN